ncbi:MULTISPECIES: molybdenum cofactor biosynthesis protein MoaE [Sphingomonas]|jgi:molybdopterin synthase catalytic subunit|uniref:Molybdopterin synthase catalytic subunit n=1 Tax=Sphingomonas hankookensis TaxID=563996 RepID=A0ABR5YCJ3_9SPHN|nr:MULTISPECIES: molybdenum cofactor biosynthesis protein MoaE [Sphingomonas]KZE13677.1 molybdopterin synthase catalytic subunit [Sphingomonas hankookensis]PZT91159.1 MAG: molybdopterin synthase catalytic subunit [Sphingomonas sp.]RSV24895.1 molybdopterin synthase catalytic subunit [Sphingomonas sp. ABOLH]
MIRVVVQAAPIDLAAEFAAAEGADAGAVATFTGLVRGDDGVTELALEHYPGATERALEALCEQAVARWSLVKATVVHRVGPMVPGDRVVFVATTARHRGAALEACAFLIDRLKTGAPFWKRERRGAETRWVETRESDDAAAARWGDLG